MAVSTKEQPDFWRHVTWHEMRGTVRGAMPVTPAGVLVPAVAILGLCGLALYALLRMRTPLVTWALCIGVLVALVAYVIIKAGREWRGLNQPIDPYGRTQLAFVPADTRDDVLFYGPKFRLVVSPPSGEALELNDILNGAPQVGLVSTMFNLGLVALTSLLLLPKGSGESWILPAGVGALAALRFAIEHPYMGGQVTPGRIEVWRWRAWVKEQFTPATHVLVVHVDDSQFAPRDLGWARQNRHFWPARACLKRQPERRQPLAISVRAVRRGTSKSQIIARWCDPNSAELTRLLSLWVDTPIIDGTPPWGTHGTVGVFTPANPEAAAREGLIGRTK